MNKEQEQYTLKDCFDAIEENKQLQSRVDALEARLDNLVGLYVRGRGTSEEFVVSRDGGLMFQNTPTVKAWKDAIKILQQGGDDGKAE